MWRRRIWPGVHQVGLSDPIPVFVGRFEQFFVQQYVQFDPAGRVLSTATGALGTVEVSVPNSDLTMIRIAAQSGGGNGGDGTGAPSFGYGGGGGGGGALAFMEAALTPAMLGSVFTFHLGNPLDTDGATVTIPAFGSVPALELGGGLTAQLNGSRPTFGGPGGSLLSGGAAPWTVFNGLAGGNGGSSTTNGQDGQENTAIDGFPPLAGGGGGGANEGENAGDGGDGTKFNSAAHPWFVVDVANGGDGGSGNTTATEGGGNGVSPFVPWSGGNQDPNDLGSAGGGGGGAVGEGDGGDGGRFGGGGGGGGGHSSSSGIQSGDGGQGGGSYVYIWFL